MDGSNFMLGTPQTTDNYHTDKLFVFQRSRSMENSETMEDFKEEDIWGGAVDAEAKQAGIRENGYNVVEESMVGKEGIWNISICHQENNNRRINQSYSVPVNIPLWNQMLWEKKKNVVDDCWMTPHYDNSGDDEGGDIEMNIIPPHEFIAMELARNEIASFSLYEGLGRTPKARDAAWTMTGFIE